MQQKQGTFVSVYSEGLCTQELWWCGTWWPFIGMEQKHILEGPAIRSESLIIKTIDITKFWHHANVSTAGAEWSQSQIKGWNVPGLDLPGKCTAQDVEEHTLRVSAIRDFKQILEKFCASTSSAFVEYRIVRSGTERFEWAVPATSHLWCHFCNSTLTVTTTNSVTAIWLRWCSWV